MPTRASLFLCVWSLPHTQVLHRVHSLCAYFSLCSLTKVLKLNEAGALVASNSAVFGFGPLGSWSVGIEVRGRACAGEAVRVDSPTAWRCRGDLLCNALSLSAVTEAALHPEPPQGVWRDSGDGKTARVRLATTVRSSCKPSCNPRAGNIGVS